MNLEKIKVVLVILLASMLTSLYAGITKEQAKDLVLTQILADKIGKVDVFSLKTVKNGSSIAILDRELNCTYNSNWVFFVDDLVFADWSHPCRYIFVDEETGEYQIINDTFPPLDMSDFEKISQVDYAGENNLQTNPNAKIQSSLEPSNHNYAVIISGGYNSSENYKRYWNNMSAIYCTLTDVYGYKPENIYVHSSDGTVVNNWGSLDLDKDGTDDILYPASKSSIESTFNRLAYEVDSDDQLFVYVTDHGYTDGTIVLWGYDSISPSELDDMLDPLDTAETITVLGQCHSGGFITNSSNITDPHRVVHAASSVNESTFAELWLTYGRYSEFVFYWTAAARGFYPGFEAWELGYKTDEFPFDLYFRTGPEHPPAYDPDIDGDGFVQMNEAFDYARNMDTWSPYGYYNIHPYAAPEYQNYEVHSVSYQDIGIQEDLLNLNGLCGIVNIDQTLTGNCMVSPSLIAMPSVGLTLAETSIFTLSENSTLTLMENSSFGAYLNSTFDLKENSRIELIDNSYMSTPSDMQIAANATFAISQNSEVHSFSGLSISEGVQLSLEGSGLMRAAGINLDENSVLQGEKNKIELYGKDSGGISPPWGMFANGCTIRNITMKSYGFAPIYITKPTVFDNTKLDLDNEGTMYVGYSGNSSTELTLINNSELLCGTLFGSYPNNINVTDGSIITPGTYPSFGSINFFVNTSGIFNYNNSCSFYDCDINISDLGQLNFMSGDIYSPSVPIIAGVGGLVVLEENSELIASSDLNLTMESGSSIVINDGSLFNIVDNYTFSLASGTNIVSAGNASIQGDINLTLESNLTVGISSILSIKSGSNIYMNSGSYITLEKGSELIIEDGANVILEEGANIVVNGDAAIIGNLNIPASSSVEVASNSELHIQQTYLSEINFQSDSNLKLNENSKLYIENGVDLFANPGTVVNVSENSEIIIMNKGKINANGTTFTYTDPAGTWLGINATSGSSIAMNNVNLSGADTGVKGIDNYQFDITSSIFEDCINGINVERMKVGYEYNIISNTITGINEGRGITITQSGSIGKIHKNTIANFSRGITAISCSPNITMNTIHNNVFTGLYITGMNSSPKLVYELDENQMLPYRYLNNKIYDNGYVPYLPDPHFITDIPGQICVFGLSSIYMRNGQNNVFSNGSGVPCIVYGSSFLPADQDQLAIYHINVERNYWGSSNVTDNFFRTGHLFTIDYDPIASSPWGQLPATSPAPEEDKPYSVLYKAMEAEFDGKYDKAIKSYLKIIKKYPDSEEALVAYAQLPDNYIREGLDLEPLIAMYDVNIALEEGSVNKKFFKEMKVSTKIMNKKYDDAIALSEEMILEADSEEEETLCQIDIAIANMMKDAESNEKGRSTVDYSTTVSELLAKLTESNKESEKTDIVGSALPTEFTLYQNYPNPFNPTTEIKYALSQDASVSIRVYTSNGSVVADLVNASQSIGQHSVTFDASKLTNGIFYYSLVANGKVVSTKKMLLLK
ncbi:MAG: T9SS type A sorting domain-containing protein [Candidatus Delongbacteria bacterium]|nr:T9SS type A sorting domain-containing protein [Candidatus Delongbacteria bacterium]